MPRWPRACSSPPRPWSTTSVRCSASSGRTRELPRSGRRGAAESSSRARKMGMRWRINRVVHRCPVLDGTLRLRRVDRVPGGESMPRYLVERVFEEGVDLPRAFESAELCAAIVAGNLRAEVTWLHSYVSTDGRTMFCVYDGPSPEAVRHAALVNRL